MKRVFSTVLIVGLLLGVSGLAFAQDEKAPPERSAQGFKAMDANGDGKLTKEEYLDRARQLAEKRWAKLDVNKRGFITVEDLQAARDKRKAEGKGRKGKQPPAADGAPSAPAAPAAP